VCYSGDLKCLKTCFGTYRIQPSISEKPCNLCVSLSDSTMNIAIRLTRPDFPRQFQFSYLAQFSFPSSVIPPKNNASPCFRSNFIKPCNTDNYMKTILTTILTTGLGPIQPTECTGNYTNQIQSGEVKLWGENSRCQLVAAIETKTVTFR